MGALESREHMRLSEVPWGLALGLWLMMQHIGLYWVRVWGCAIVSAPSEVCCLLAAAGEAVYYLKDRVCWATFCPCQDQRITGLVSRAQQHLRLVHGSAALSELVAAPRNENRYKSMFMTGKAVRCDIQAKSWLILDPRGSF